MQCSVIAERRGKVRLALFYADEARQLAEECGDQQTEARLLNNLGGLSFLAGDAGPAVAYIKQAFALFLEIGNDADAAQAVSSLAQIHLRLGAPILAEEQARHALSILDGRDDYSEERGNAHLVLGRALLGQNAAERLWRSSRPPSACSSGWGRRATSPRPGRPRAMHTQSLVTQRPRRRCTGARPSPCRTSISRKGGAFVKKEVRSLLGSVLLACCCVLRRCGQGRRPRPARQGFLQRRVERATRVWP